MEPLVFVNTPIPQINTVSNFLTLLEGLLSPVQATRSECLVFFEQLKQTHFIFLLEALTEILFHLKQAQDKILALILLRQIFSSKSPQEVWSMLNSNLRKKFIQNLLTYSQTENSKTILKHLADVINEFNLSFNLFFKKHCTDFLDTAISICSNSSHLTYLGLLVISGYFVYFNDCFAADKETLFRIFEVHLNSDNAELKISAAHSFTSLIFSVEMSHAMYFSQLIKPLFKAFITYGNFESFSKLADSAEAEPFFYYKKFNLCLEFVKVILKSEKDIQSKFMACKFISDICVNTLDCSKTHLTSSIQIIKSFLIKFPLKIPDSIEIDYLDLSCELIAEILTSHLEILDDFIQFIQENILSTGITSYISGVLQLEKVIFLFKDQVSKLSDLITQSTDDYATLLNLKCIGNIWKYSKYSKLDITKLISINLQGISHPLELIQTQAIKSLSNFIERGNKSIVLKQSHIILNYLFDNLNPFNQNENLQMICKYFRRFKSELNFQNIPEKLITIASTENYSEVLLCLSEMQNFYPVDILVQDLISTINLCQHPLNHKNLSTWELIFKHFPKLGSIYIEVILPPILSVLTEIIKSYSNIQENYIQTLIYLAGHKSCFSYLPQINWIAARLFESQEEEIQTLGSHLSVTILKTMRLNKDQSVNQLAKIYTKSIWKSFMIHSEPHCKLENLQALHDLMETFDKSFLTKSEAEWLMSSLFDCMKSNTGFELMIEECRLAAYIYSKHNGLSLDLLYISIDVLTGYLEIASEGEKFIVIRALREFIEITGPLMGDRRETILLIFFRFSEYFDEKVREQAIMGLGAYSTVCEVEEFSKKGLEILQILERSISNQKIYNHRYFNRCRNSAILTIGILLVNHFSCFELAKVIQLWIWLLPLHGDKTQVKKSEQILSELLKKHSFAFATLGEKNIMQIKNILKESYCVDLSTSIEMH